MQFKFLTALLLGACLVQVSLAQSETDIQQQRGYVQDLKNQAKAIIEQLTKFMTETLNDALRTFDQLKDQALSIAREATASAEQLLTNIVSDAQKQIQEIATRAKGLGVDISACIVSESRFQNLLRDFLNDEVQCVQKEIDRVSEIINEPIEITDEVQDLPGKLWDCGSELSSIRCIHGVMLQATKSEAQLPLYIARKIAQTTSYVAGLETRLQVCAATQIAGAGIETAKIVAGVGQCAAAAIGDNIRN